MPNSRACCGARRSRAATRSRSGECRAGVRRRRGSRCTRCACGTSGSSLSSRPACLCSRLNVAVCASMPPRNEPGRHQRARRARRHRRRADELRLQPPVRLGEVAGRAARGRLLAVVAAQAARHHRQIGARHQRLLRVRVHVAERATDAAHRVQLVVELEVRTREHDPRRLGRRLRGRVRRRLSRSPSSPRGRRRSAQRPAPAARPWSAGRDRSCGRRGRRPRAG